MQPKFTLRSLGSLCAVFIAMMLIMAATSQFATAQERPGAIPAAVSDNDAGLPNKTIVPYQTENPQAICTTFTGSVGPANTATSLRAYRDGSPSTPCGNPGSCTSGLSGSYHYVQHSWTNPVSSTQCVTVSFANPSGSNMSFVTAHNGSVNVSNLCLNWLGDPGSSVLGGGSPIDFQINVPGNATVIFHVTNVSSGQTANYSITVDAPLCTGAPCSGTPNPGNTQASTTLACPTSPVNLTLQNLTPGSGVSYQWQTAASSSGPWTNAGPNSSSWAATQTSPTWYRCIVTCSGNSGTSTPVFVDQNPFYNCYCANSASSNADEDIFNVTIGTLNQTSDCSTTAPGPGSVNRRYSNYKNVGPPAVANGTITTGNMPISIQLGTCGGNYTNGVAVWIDIDHNGVFDHPAERVYMSSPQSGPHTTSGIAVIPASALTGITGMRVKNVETSNMASVTPCSAFSWGEVEDYLVNIEPCVQLNGVSAPSDVNAECSGIAAIPVNVGGSNFASYQWEYRVNSASPWFFATDGGLGGVVTGATTGSLVLINVPTSLDGYQFRAIVTNPCSAPDFTSPPTTLHVGPLVARVTPTSATICRGDIIELKLQSPQATFCSGTVNVAVPDYDDTGISSVINVSGIPTSATITEIKVQFNMTHTWVGDMVMNLKAPNGQTINLFGLLNNGTGSNGTANFVNTVVTSDNSFPAMSGAPAPRTGTFRADRWVATVPTIAPTTTTVWAPLQSAATINGNWTLAMCDLGPGDLGVLQDWCITISFGAPVTGIWTQSPAAPNSMFTDAGATVAYTGTPRANIYVRPLSNTSYTVVASTSSPSCTSAPVVIPVNVTQPYATLVHPTNKTVCVGGTTAFGVIVRSASGSPYDGPFTYQWQETRNNGITWNNVANGGVYSGANTNTLTLTGVTRSAGSDMNNYKYRCIIGAPPCAGTVTSNEALLTVLALPAVTITASDLALTPGQVSNISGTSSPAPLNATSWSWTLNGSAIPGNTNTVSANIDQLGVYRATVTDVNGCTNTSNSLLVETEASDRLWIYPNPTSGQFQVRLYHPGVFTERRKLVIYNSNGQEVMSREMTLSNMTHHYLRMDVDLSMQPAGTYVVKVIEQSSKKATSGLVIKQSQ